MLKGLGCNRLSIGVQSFDDNELAALGRRHDAAKAARAVEAALAAGFSNIGLDLMYGLPGQTKEGWQATLERALSLGPAHLSCYQLTLEGETPLSRMVARQERSVCREKRRRATFSLRRRASCARPVLSTTRSLISPCPAARAATTRNTGAMFLISASVLQRTPSTAGSAGGTTGPSSRISGRPLRGRGRSSRTRCYHRGSLPLKDYTSACGRGGGSGSRTCRRRPCLRCGSAAGRHPAAAEREADAVAGGIPGCGLAACVAELMQLSAICYNTKNIKSKTNALCGWTRACCGIALCGEILALRPPTYMRTPPVGKAPISSTYRNPLRRSSGRDRS